MALCPHTAAESGTALGRRHGYWGPEPGSPRAMLAEGGGGEGLRQQMQIPMESSGEKSAGVGGGFAGHWSPQGGKLRGSSWSSLLRSRAECPGIKSAETTASTGAFEVLGGKGHWGPLQSNHRGLLSPPADTGSP